MNFQHMSQDEVVQHIENHGTDEQKLLLSILYTPPDELSWEECPYCSDTDKRIEKARDAIVAALEDL